MSQITRTACLIVLSAGVAPGIAVAQEIDWDANGRDVQGTRYLPAREITRENVGRLEPAWTYRTGETDASFATEKETSFEATTGLAWKWCVDCRTRVARP